MSDPKIEQLKYKIGAYFNNLADEVFPSHLKDKASILLSGSTGWGIKEGFDSKADWDLHIILDNKSYEEFSEKFGENYVIDDQNNSPIVFGQIRSKKWLEDRISKIEQGDCLYTWIYNNGIVIQDPQNIENLAKENLDLFHKNEEEFARYHYVTFAVRRLDTSSSAKRNIEVGARISNAEMAKAALQTFSIINSKPYPYNKWLPKHVEMMGEDGKRCVELSEQSLKSESLDDIIKNAKLLRLFIEEKAQEKYGDKLWISEWWKFNQNPPEMNLVNSKKNGNNNFYNLKAERDGK